MGNRAVAFMPAKSVAGVLPIQIDHHAISHYLRHAGRQRDRPTAAVTGHDSPLIPTVLRETERIAEHVIGRRLQAEGRVTQERRVDVSDPALIDLPGRRRYDRNGDAGLNERLNERLAARWIQHLRVIDAYTSPGQPAGKLSSFVGDRRQHDRRGHDRTSPGPSPGLIDTSDSLSACGP